jgi:hypothetical protein
MHGSHEFRNNLILKERALSISYDKNGRCRKKMSFNLQSLRLFLESEV